MKRNGIRHLQQTDIVIGNCQVPIAEWNAAWAEGEKTPLATAVNALLER